MRDPMNDVMMNLMTGRGEPIIRYLNIIRIVEAEYYRVSQKKLSLVEIACGKYNSNIGEKSSRSFDKSW